MIKEIFLFGILDGSSRCEWCVVVLAVGAVDTCQSREEMPGGNHLVRTGG